MRALSTTSFPEAHLYFAFDVVQGAGLPLVLSQQGGKRRDICSQGALTRCQTGAWCSAPLPAPCAHATISAAAGAAPWAGVPGGKTTEFGVERKELPWMYTAGGPEGVGGFIPLRGSGGLTAVQFTAGRPAAVDCADRSNQLLRGSTLHFPTSHQLVHSRLQY